MFQIIVVFSLSGSSSPRRVAAWQACTGVTISLDGAYVTIAGFDFDSGPAYQVLTINSSNITFTISKMA